MLVSKCEELRVRGEVDESRLWKAFTLHFMQGLPCEDISAPATSVGEFLDEYGMLHHDGPSKKSGVTALLLSVIAGNAEVVRALARQNPGDVTTQVKFEFRTLAIAVGATPLHAAVSFCPTNSAAIITTLLEHGADPNAAFDTAGLPPLSCGAVMHSIAGLEALSRGAGDRLEIEKGNRVNCDTALGGAAYLGTPTVVESLLAMGADPAHVNDSGSTKLMSACENPSATPEMLSSLCRDESVDVCCRRKPKTLKMALKMMAREVSVRRGFATSAFALEMAHRRGDTALHCAARHGHTPLVKFLLDHGASPSLHVKNAMGCTPLDTSRIFGPYPETEAVLTQAILQSITSLPPLSPTCQPESNEGSTMMMEQRYPMYLLSVRTLLALSVLPRHEELLEQRGALVQWHPTMRAVFYVSLEWSSDDHPDPGGERLDVLKCMLIRMIEGQAAQVEADFATQTNFGKAGLKITPGDWHELARDAHIYIAYCSSPTVQSASLEAAKQSFSAYIDRVTHFMALCPPVPYIGEPGRTCNFRSWRDRGIVRVELSSLLLASTLKPAIVIQGAEAPTPVISPFSTISLQPGQGHFSCCEKHHMRTKKGDIAPEAAESGAGGVAGSNAGRFAAQAGAAGSSGWRVLLAAAQGKRIPCVKAFAGQVMTGVLLRRINDHRLRGELDEMRLWKASMPRFVQGLSVETSAEATTVDAFLLEYEYPREADKKKSHDVSPLLLAVMAGKLGVTRELARVQPTEVPAHLMADFPALNLWIGFEPIHAAVAYCVTNQIAIITTLLEKGANPNVSSGNSGFTPLHTAAITHNHEGMSALVEVAGNRLEIDKENHGSRSDTALGIAARFGTQRCVEALLAANANSGHINCSGRTKLMLACENTSATPAMLTSLNRAGTIDVCQRVKPIVQVLARRPFEMAAWKDVMGLGVESERLHMRGATAMHAAASHGHTDLVRWLLEHKAGASLSVKNAMGCTPLGVTREFGPFPETAAVLIQSIMSVEFDESHTIMADGKVHLITSRRRAGASRMGLGLRRSVVKKQLTKKKLKVNGSRSNHIEMANQTQKKLT